MHRGDPDRKMELPVNEPVGEVTEGNHSQNPGPYEIMVSEEEGLKEGVVTDEEEPSKKEKRRVRTMQPPPPELLDLNPSAMASKILAMELRVAAKSQVMADSCAHLTESQEDAQIREDTAMACTKQENKRGADPDLYMNWVRNQVKFLILLGRAQWKDEITTCFKIEAANRLQGMDSQFNLMGQGQVKKEKNRDFDEGKLDMKLLG